MTRTASRKTPRGVTLIELMVGLAIGLLATLVIAQVLSVSEGRRRTTVSGSDAQVSGSLALYSLQREIQMAGYGVSASTTGLGCAVRAQRAGTNRNFTLAPVIITQGGAGAPDSIEIQSSAKQSYSVPTRVTAAHNGATETVFSVATTVGIAVGDVMVAVPPVIDVNNWCSVFNVTGVTGVSQISHVTGANGPWNQAPGSTIQPASYAAGTFLVNVGPFVRRTMSVSANSTLQVTSFDFATVASTTEDLFPDIVNLKALYAKDTNGDGLADTYDAVTPTTEAGWMQVQGVRLAVVSRSAQMEKENVTFANPLWDVGTTGAVAGSAVCGTSRCVTLTVNTLPDWQRYRYRVYDTLVPLRNLLWRS
jgi:type IV pilus assembly protein PilW